MSDTGRQYISLQEAAKICGYSQEYLALRARQGKLKSTKFGRNWVTTKEWINQYVAQVENYNKQLELKSPTAIQKEFPQFKFPQFKLPKLSLPKLPEMPAWRVSGETKLPLDKILFSLRSLAPFGLKPVLSLGLVLLLLGAGLAIQQRSGFLHVATELKSVMADAGQVANQAARNPALKENIKTTAGYAWEYSRWVGQELLKQALGPAKQSLEQLATTYGAANDLVEEKLISFGENLIGFPQKVFVLVKDAIDPVKSFSFSFKLPKISFPSLPKFSWPQFSLPQFALPRVSVPQISWPQFSLPQFSLPKINLTRFAQIEFSEMGIIYWDLNNAIEEKIVTGSQELLGLAKQLAGTYERTNYFVERKIVQLFQDGGDRVSSAFRDATSGIRSLTIGLGQFGENVWQTVSGQIAFFQGEGQKMVQGGQRLLGLAKQLANFLSQPWRGGVVYQPGISVEDQRKISDLESEMRDLKEKGLVVKERVVEVSRVTQIQPVKEITKETIIQEIPTETLALIMSDIEAMRGITKKLQANPPTINHESAPIYIGSQGIQTTGNAMFASLGVSGFGSFGNLSAGDTSLGSSSSDYLTVNATSTFASPTNFNNTVTVNSGNLDMGNNLLLNVGNASTDFTAGGGLNLAGNVGIGTTAPGYTLEVIGDQRLSSNLTIGTTATPTLYVGAAGSASGFAFQNTGFANILSNASFETDGDANGLADQWTNSGLSATSQSATALYHSYSQLATADAATDHLYQSVAASEYDDYKGKTVVASVWVRLSGVAETAQISVYDGVTTSSQTITTSSSWQRLYVTHTVSASATELTFRLYPATDGVGSALFDGALLQEGQVLSQFALKGGDFSSIGSNLLPAVDNTYDLGSANLRWRDLYLGPASLNISDTTGTLGAGTDYVNSTLGFSGEQLQLLTSLQGAQATGGNILIQSAYPIGGGVTSAIKVSSANNLGATDAVFQISDSAADFLTIRGDGNVGIGTTSPGSKLEVAGTLTVSGSNLTSLGGNLTVTGTAWTATPTISGLITATSGLTANGTVTVAAGFSQTGANTFGTGTGTVSLNGDTTIASGKNLTLTSGNLTLSSGLLTQTGAGNNSFAGNVGVGTTNPLQALHVVGQCVTGDTKLRRRRRKRRKTPDVDGGTSGVDDDEWEDVRIDQIKAGDEIQTLDENTGQLVVSKVNGLMDMGTKPIYKLTTASGKTIRTTGNHPYLALQKSKTFAFVDASNIIYRETDKNSWPIDLKKLIKYLKERFEATRVFYYAGIDNRDKVQQRLYHKMAEWGYEMKLNPVKNFVNARGEWYQKADVDARMSFEIMKYLPDYNKAVILTGDGDFYWVLKYLLENKQKVWLLANAGKTAKELKELIKGDFANLDNLRQRLEFNPNKKEADSTNDSASDITDASITERLAFVKGRGRWTKVSHLFEGDYIAVTENEKEAVFEKVVKIENLPAEQVWDIEVEDTHNFVGNGIVAHNTYLRGSGTTTGFSLRTADSAGTDRFVVLDNGNIGIGTTNPAAALEIGGSGNVRIGGLTASLGVYTDASKNLVSTPPTTGVLGYWSRTGTTLSPSNAGDDIVLPTGDWIGLSSSLTRLVFNDATRDNITLTDGDLLFSADNTWDIGATGATRPRTGYFGTSVIVGSTSTLTTNALNFSTAATMSLTTVVNALNIDADTLTIDALNNRVGIGTTAPAYTLSVIGTLNASSAISQAGTAVVLQTRNLATTSPLAGGGDLSADRTLTVGGLSSLGTANYVVGANAGATAWEYKQILGTTSEIDVTHGVGSITIGLVDPLAVSKGGTGATTLNDLITLGTHTSGNYVATLADSGGSTITVNNSGTENAAVTLGITADSIGDTQLAFNTGQHLTTAGAPQFARLGLGTAADATNILTATSSSTTDLSKTLNVTHTGAVTGTGYAGYFSKTGASTTNVGLYATASGATSNYAAIFEAGNVGIGTTAPSALFSVGSTSQFQVNSSGQVASGAWQASLIGLAYGGTNANLTASNGGVFYSTATAGAILAGTTTANQVLLSGASTTPAWSTATYPSTTTVSQLLYSSSSNVIVGLATANSGVLVTSSTGVPSILGSMTNGQLVIGSTGATPVLAALTGTANQITVTNGAGSITLSSPQDIATSSTPQFARLGLGTAADATNILTATSASTADLSKTLNVTHTGAVTGTGYAGYFSKTGAATANVALYATASGATSNYAAIFEAGNVGIGTTGPGSALDVKGTLRLSGSTSGYVGLAPAATAGSTTYTLPSADGTSGQVLSTSGAGVLSWTTGGSGFSVWSALTAPTANLSLAHGAYTTAFTFDSVTTANAFALSSSGLITGTLLNLASTSTAGGVSGSSKLLNLSRSGANASASHTAYGLYSAVTNTGTTSINIAGYLSASGAITNYGLVVAAGNVGIGTTGPNRILDVLDTSNPQLRLSQVAGSVFTEFQVAATTGDLTITVSGSNIIIPNNNFLVCTGGACPALSLSTNGNLVVETDIFASGYRRISCPTGMVEVPPSPQDGMDGFCVDKYEEKNVGALATSAAAGTPWISITQFAARAECIRAGKHLITEKEWQAIAHNVENVGWNWNGGVAGTNQMSDGHSDNVPAASLAADVTGDPDDDPCVNTGQTCSITTWDSQRRTYKLSNNSYIWDFGGDVWEWVDQANVSDYPIYNSPAAGWQACSTSGDGICGNTRTTNDQWYRGGVSTLVGFVHGGSWPYGALSGAFALGLSDAPATSHTHLGFRCAR